VVLQYLVLLINTTFLKDDERLAVYHSGSSQSSLFCNFLWLYCYLGISMIAFLVAATIEYRCIKWTWTGDVFNRKVVCIEWKKVEKNDPVRPDKRPK